MGDGFHIPTYMKQNKKTSCDCFKWGQKGLTGRDVGSNVTKVQYKSNWNYDYETPKYHEYIPIKIYFK
jgi:hypothetical protein